MVKQGTAKRLAVPPTATGTALRKAKKRSHAEENPAGERGKAANAKKPKVKASPATPTSAAPVPSTKAPRGNVQVSKQKDTKEMDVSKPKKPAPQSQPTKYHGDAAAASHTLSPPFGFRIVAGSYERFLYGLEGKMHKSGDVTYSVKLEPRFIFPAHVSSIRSVACAGRDSKWLVTGGTDETIKVWDLRRRKEVGALTGHEGTITSLTFPSRTFLLSTSEDGTMNLYRTRDWALLRTLRGHAGRVNAANAHPSGRVALSVGADRMIRMWDLMRGTGSASVKIGVEADRILWDTQGKRFAVLAGRQVMVFATDMTKLAEIEQSKRLHDMLFVQGTVQSKEHELLLVCSEAGVVHVYDMDDLQEMDDSATPKELARLVGHQNRVRSVSAVKVLADDRTTHLVITTISSDGLIRVFELPDLHEDVQELEPMAYYDTKKSRLTCLSTVGFDDQVSEADEDALDAAVDDDDDDDEDEEEVVDEDSDEELARLEEEIRQARAAGIIVEGMDDEDDEEEEEEEEEEEDA